MEEIESKNAFNFISPLWKNLSFKRRRQLFISLQLIILNGILDLLSVTSILPLLYLLTSNPEAVFEKPFVKFISNIFLIKDPNQLLIFSTVLFAFVALFSGFLKLSNLFFTSRISGAIASDFSNKVFSKVLFQPYTYHVNINSSEVISTITTYINNLNSGLISLLQFVTSSILSIFIITGLLLINWRLSTIGFIIYASLYFLIAIFAKKRLNKNSKVVTNSNIYIVKEIQEALGSIRDIILDNLHKYYINSHKNAEFSMRKLIAQNLFLTFFPRYALESITLVLISLIIFFRASLFGDSESIIPTLGALSIGIQKLLPSFQSLYTSWASINSQKSSINKVIKFIDLYSNNKEYSIYPSSDKKDFNDDFKSLCISNVSFKYPSSNNYIFKDLNLKISKGEIIGIIGKTGDGKSTLLDILMGLVPPTSGKVLINKKDIYSDKFYLNFLQRKISHVPQNIYLSDRTIAENIALGYPKKFIDLKKLYFSAKQAQIDEFINSLSEKHDSIVGEGGMKISGGQRQRIGIARALYNSPGILILDEATSALDEETEKSIMESITNISDKLTVIVVAHRLKTMSYCHRVIRIKRGQIIADGTPSQVIENIE